MEENVDTVESSQPRSILKKWLQWKSNKDPASHKPDQVSGKSRKPPNRRSPSHSPPRVNEGPSRMAAAQPTPVSIVP